MFTKKAADEKAHVKLLSSVPPEDVNSTAAIQSSNTCCSSSSATDKQFSISVKRPLYSQDQFDNEYGYVEGESSCQEWMRRELRGCCRCNKDSVFSCIFKFFPILHWLPRYKFKKNFLSDVIAGLTVGVMHLPQGMGYASLAGVAPVYGLYTSFFPTLVYIFFGTSGHTSMGTFAVAALMVGSVTTRLAPSDPSENSARNGSSGNSSSNSDAFESAGLSPVDVVLTLTFLVGIIQLIFGIFHLGILSVYLSDQLVAGYTTGSAVMVLTAQVDKVFGIKIDNYNGAGKLYYTYRDLILALPSTNIATLITSVICLVTIYVVKEYFNSSFKKKFRIPFPIELITIIVATLSSYYGHFDKQWKIKTVNHIPTGLPSPRLPRFELMWLMIGDAFGLAIVVFTVTVSMAKIFAKRHNYKIDPNQEWFALAMCEMVSAVFQSFTSVGAIARSVVNEEAGASSQLSGVFSSLVLLVVLLFLGPLFEPLPQCVLAAIIIVALKGLFVQLKELRELWPVSKIDFSIWLLSFLSTCVLDVQYGLYVSVIYSVCTVVIRSQMPSVSLLGRIPSTDMYKDVKRYSSAYEVCGIKIYRFDSGLNYANTELFREKLYKYCQIDVLEISQRFADRQKQLRKEKKLLGNERLSSSERFRKIFAFKKRAAAAATECNDRHLQNVQNSSPKDELNEVESEAGCGVTDINNEPSSSHDATAQVDDELGAADVRCVIIDCSGFNYIDVTGVQILQQVYRELKQIQILCVLASCKAPVREMFLKTGFYQHVPKSLLFLSIQDAVVFCMPSHLKARMSIVVHESPLQALEEDSSSYVSEQPPIDDDDNVV